MQLLLRLLLTVRLALLVLRVVEWHQLAFRINFRQLCGLCHLVLHLLLDFCILAGVADGAAGQALGHA